MKQYLVVQIARFGDLVQSKRLILSLMSRNDGQVHLLVDSSLAGLAAIVYPKTTVHSITAHGTGLSAHQALKVLLVDNRQCFDRLRSLCFDEVYNLNFSPLNFKIASLFDPETVFGHRWKDGQEIIPQWASMAMRWSNARRIAINIADFWAAYAGSMHPANEVNPPASPKGNGIGIVLAGRESRRSLPPDLLARVTAVFAARHSGPVRLLGSRSEMSAGESVLTAMSHSLRSRTENLAGKTDWSTLVEIVSGFDVLLTPDTGTMHLAAHLGTPVQAFFLSSAWCFETGPYGVGHTVYQAVQDCLPCLETAPCSHGVKCLDAFADSKFLRALTTGKEEHMPEGITRFLPDFDGLGLTFRSDRSEKDSDSERRRAFRHFLATFLQLESPSVDKEDVHLARILYQDKDMIFG